VANDNRVLPMMAALTSLASDAGGFIGYSGSIS